MVKLPESFSLHLRFLCNGKNGSLGLLHTNDKPLTFPVAKVVAMGAVYVSQAKITKRQL